MPNNELKGRCHSVKIEYTAVMSGIRRGIEFCSEWPTLMDDCL